MPICSSTRRTAAYPLIADWDLGSTTLTSITAWRYWKWDVANDRDYTGMPIQMVQRIPSRQDQYSQELRFASNGDGPLQLCRRALLLHAGDLRHSDQHLRAGGRVLAAQPGEFHGADPAQPARRLRADGHLGLRDGELRAFGEVNYAFTERLTGTWACATRTRTRKALTRRRCSAGSISRGSPPATAAELLRAKLSIFRPQSYTAADDGGSFSGRANIAYAVHGRPVRLRELCARLQVGRPQHVGPAARRAEPADAGDRGDRGRDRTPPSRWASSPRCSMAARR